MPKHTDPNTTPDAPPLIQPAQPVIVGQHGYLEAVCRTAGCRTVSMGVTRSDALYAHHEHHAAEHAGHARHRALAEVAHIPTTSELQEIFDAA